MARTLHDRIRQALTDRSVWEEKQRLWYTMRHEGLPRRTKPFPGAADLHMPLGDNAVEKQKPFYVGSIFSREKLAAFTPLNAEELEASASAAECLDWKIRKESNYVVEFGFWLDHMLVCGRGISKVLWDVEAKRLKYEAVDPLFFIVPKGTDNLQEADWVCHVKQLSVAAYQRDARYDQDPDLIKRITGGTDQVDKFGKEQEKAQREGITYSSDEDTIVLWESWEKIKDGSWRVSTYSPCAVESPVRPDFLCPYLRQEKPYLPFVAWQWEVTEKGWYAPRGVIEKVAAHETYATKLWNGKADFLEYSMRPLFSAEPGYEIKGGNVRIRPGEIMPPGIKPVTMPSPPMELEEEINSVRVLAEESVQSPDFGAHREGNQNESRTATEISYVQSFASQSVQYRGQISGQSEGELYGMSWALLVQFGAEELSYFSAHDRKVLPDQAKHDNYLIEPDAQPDAWNKTLRAQRAVGRFQMFKGDPDIDQIELKRSVLEADDPRLVKRLLIGKGTAEADEKEDEAKDVLLLEAGWPAAMIAVKPAENHALRLTVLFGRLDMLNKLGVPPNPLVRQNLQQHAQMHLEMLQQQNPKVARQFMQAAQVVDAGPGAGSEGGELGQGSLTEGNEGNEGAMMPAPEGMAV